MLEGKTKNNIRKDRKRKVFASECRACALPTKTRQNITDLFSRWCFCTSVNGCAKHRNFPKWGIWQYKCACCYLKVCFLVSKLQFIPVHCWWQLNYNLKKILLLIRSVIGITLSLLPQITTFWRGRIFIIIIIIIIKDPIGWKYNLMWNTRKNKEA